MTWQSPCTAPDRVPYEQIAPGSECAFCFSHDRCNPGLICHCGVCRNPDDPDVACQLNQRVFDYVHGICTQEVDTQGCDFSSYGSPDDVVKAQAIQAAWEQEQANPKGWEASEIITGIASLGGAVGGGWYAYKAKDGSFWWTVLGVLVGNAGGWLVGRLVTLPLR
jgi:hypothetical protein